MPPRKAPKPHIQKYFIEMRIVNSSNAIYDIVSLDGKIHSTHTSVAKAREALREAQGDEPR